MYGSIFIQFCAVASKRRIFSAPECVLAVQGRSGSSKADDFGTNRKRVCDFLLVHHCDYGAILHRFWDTATYWLKIAYFSYPSLIRRPRSLCSLWNFAIKLSRAWGNKRHGAIFQWSPHDRSLSRFDSVPACDRQTVRQMDGFTIANTALCIGWDRYRYRVSGIGRYCWYRFRIGIGNNFPDTSTDTNRPRTSYGCIMKNNGPSLMRNIKQIKSTTSCL